MSKLKTLKESRAAVFAKIDELRTATDGREMTSEEQERWNTLLAEYEQADRAVEAEERYVDIERRQAEQEYVRLTFGEQSDEFTLNNIIDLVKGADSSCGHLVDLLLRFGLADRSVFFRQPAVGADMHPRGEMHHFAVDGDARYDGDGVVVADLAFLNDENYCEGIFLHP